jgi:uncharacterized protein with PIN domain
MVIDTSALVAILEDEPERARFVRLIAADDVRLLSAVSRVECTCVIEGRKRDAGRADLELFLREAANRGRSGHRRPSRDRLRGLPSLRPAATRPA